MVVNGDICEKFVKLEVLFVCGVMVGECVVVGVVWDCLQVKLVLVFVSELEIELQYIFFDIWLVWIFVVLCCKYGVKFYCYLRQCCIIVMVWVW